MRNRESSSRLWPSGVRIIAISTRWSPSPVTRPAHSPSIIPCPSSSRPSSTKNAIAAGRSSTTMPTLSIRSIATGDDLYLGFPRAFDRPDPDAALPPSDGDFPDLDEVVDRLDEGVVRRL